MRKIITVFLILITFLVATQIQTSLAAQKIYMWELPNEDWQIINEYQIVISASDSWEPDIPYEVSVTMTTKNSYDVKIDSAKVILSDENFALESLSKQEPTIFMDEGDHWTEKFAFEIPSEKLVSGENFTVSIVAVISISAVPESVDGLKGTWNNYDRPVIAKLYFPPQPDLQPFQMALIVASVASVVLVGVGFLIYFKKRKC
jgi:hypothetical protein